MLETSALIMLILIVVFGLLFALTNGLNDASAVTATFITCGAATPKQAIVLASVFGFVGSVFSGSQVAGTVSGVIDLPAQSALLPVLLAAVLGAILWNLLTWKLGLPSSSTHALIGGIVGAVLVSHGAEHVNWGLNALLGPAHQVTGIVKVVIFLFVSPFLGLVLGFLVQTLSELVLRRARVSANRWLKRVQWLFSAMLAFTHGANDIQKITALIVLALVSAGGVPIIVAPLWVRLSGGAVMLIGTMLGGWSIMKTIGQKIFRLKPIHSMSSQLSAAGSVFAANLLGAPVSTTQVVVGSVMGVGAADRYKMVNWAVAREISVAWVITMPLSGALSALIYLIISFILRLF